MALTRRSLLGAAVAAGSVGLAGCGAAPISSPPPKASGLVVHSTPLYEAKDALTHAWSEDHSGVGVTFIRGLVLAKTAKAYEAAYMASGDVLDHSTGSFPSGNPYLNLAPFLHTGNINPAGLIPEVAAQYRLTGSTVLAIPFFPSEFQFYANPALPLRSGRSGSARSWSWSEIVASTESAESAAPSGMPGITGTSWGDLRLWGALVTGLGARLAAGGAFSLLNAVYATEELVAFAKRVGWAPPQVHNNFGQEGFTGPGWYSQTAFAFAPPWTVFDIGNILGNQTSAIPTLGTLPFPKLPAQDVVPAYAISGLSVSAQAKNPSLAAEFLVWLLQPAQQRILCDHGFPPVISDSSILAYWGQVSKSLAPTTPKFTWHGYTDVRSIFPSPSSGSVMAAYQPILAEAFQRMYDGAEVRAQLLAAQRRIDAAARGGG